MVLFAEGSTGDGNMVLPFKSTLFGAASMAIAEGAAEQVFIQPVAIVYTRLHGVPLGRRHRPLAAWIGNEDLMPHVKVLLAEGALDVEVHFGEPIAFSKGSNRKETARLMESHVHEMVQAALADPRPSRKLERFQPEIVCFLSRKGARSRRMEFNTIERDEIEIVAENAVVPSAAAKKVFVKTYGCQMNVYDFTAHGAMRWPPTAMQRPTRSARPTWSLLNTCHIREKAAEKVYSELGRMRELKAERARPAARC